MMQTRIPQQFPKKYKNCRVVTSVRNEAPSGELDYIDEDLFAMEKVPKMELLKINYVHLNEKKNEAPSCAHNKSSKSNKSKYLVYKKHNGFGSTADLDSEKLKYVNDVVVKAKPNKRKYMIFDSKKKNKVDNNIQYYFDNRSYERYVDNKLYGVISGGGGGVGVEETRSDIGGSNAKNWEQRMSRLPRMMTSPPPPPTQIPAPNETPSNGSLKKENCRNKQQKESHDIITRHRSMNDINRINQLFQDTKVRVPENESSGRQMKYLVHKKFGSRSGNDDEASNLINKKIKQIFDAPKKTKIDHHHQHHDDKDGKTCGYKNCKFTNCPMSSASSSSASSLKDEVIKSHESFELHPKSNHLKVEKLNNENVKVISSKIKEIDLESNRMIIEKCVTPIDSFEVPQKFWNMHKNIKVKNNPKNKYDDKVNINNTIRNEENSIKIFITSQTNEPTSLSSSTATSSSASSSSSSSTTSSSDLDKDDGYCDQSISSGEHSLSPTEEHKNTLSKNKNKAIVIKVKLGCDGALFWNNTCYDENDCEKCCFGANNDGMRKNYMCECGIIKKKIESFAPRPRSIEGPPDSGISISGDTTISSPDSDLNLQSQTDSDERRLKRGHVLTELLETERIYVAEMNSILKGYLDEMESVEMSSLVPPGLKGKADVLFGNLNDLYTFHKDIFLKDLENCISTTELVALCFVQRRDTFFRLYSYYCQNIPRSERLRETLVDTHLFLQECQKKLGHKLPLAAYLLKPVQRITKYQLLLKDLLRFSDTGTCSRELQKALDCMLVVLKCVNDSMHQIAITGFPADLSQQGELLMQDAFQVWTESKKDLRLRLKTQHRHIFLYQKALLFCKQGSKTGHNKSTYQFKNWLQTSHIGLTESVRGDPRRFEIWLQGRQEVHTIQAATLEVKTKWVSEIKRVLLNQLEELKGEKIKQYGLNHKPLRQTVSWDMPQSLHLASHRAMSCDQQEISRMPHLNEDMLNATGISSSSSEHDNQETNAWSSDYSNSEDEFTNHEDNVIPGTKFISLADYCAMGHSEVTMKEGDIVELLKIGCAGWWFVCVLSTGHEGWAPAAYLETINRKASRIRARSQDKLNEH